MNYNQDMGNLSLQAFKQKNLYYFGATIGRFANRILGGGCQVDGEKYELSRNEGENCLHGGQNGFDKRVWRYRLLERADLSTQEVNVVNQRDEPMQAKGIEFTLVSADLDQGFPGEVTVSVRYVFASFPEQVVKMALFYSAKCSKKTVVNLTNHTYWQLDGVSSGAKTADLQDGIRFPSLLDTQRLQVRSETVYDLAKGELLPLRNTLLDLSVPDGSHCSTLGSIISKLEAEGTRGIDHCYLLRKDTDPTSSTMITEVATLKSQESKRQMVLETDQRAVQVYTSNYLPEDSTQFPVCKNNAVCLEAQNVPNGPNLQEKAFRSELSPCDQYSQVTVYTLSYV